MAHEINTLVNNVSFPRKYMWEFWGVKWGEEKTFYAPNVTQTARKTNMSFPEDDMMRGCAWKDFGDEMWHVFQNINST